MKQLPSPIHIERHCEVVIVSEANNDVSMDSTD